MATNEKSLCFKIHGMDCAEEVAVLKREVGLLVGGEERLSFDILNGRMVVNVGPVAISPETVIQAVARTGMRAEALPKHCRKASGPLRSTRRAR